MARNVLGPRGRRARRLALLAAPVALLAAACAVDLGSLGGLSASAEAVNDAGVAVGTADTPAGTTHAFRKAPGGVLVDVNGRAGSSRAHGVNAVGVAVGEADLGGGGMRAVRWTAGGSLVDLGLGVGSTAADINDGGTIVGSSGDDAFVRSPSGSVKILPPAAPGTLFQAANAVNTRGDVVGWVVTSGTLEQAVLWAAPAYQPVTLSQRPEDEVFATDINDRGVVVGFARYRYITQALLWRAGTHQEVALAGRPGDAYTGAQAVNEAGQVVGWAEDLSTEAVAIRGGAVGPGRGAAGAAR
jgi:probable HAF family extracellular repeat protein